MTELDALRQRCLQCTACPLARTRTNVVFGVGQAPSDIVFVGEGPGQQEDLTGGHVLAYFAACADEIGYSDFPFPTNAFGLDKKTAVMRTPDNSAWMCVDYSRESCFSITQYTPYASAGQNTEIPLSGVQVIASVPGGRYSDTVELTLSTLPGYEIVYSLDCADSVRSFRTYSGKTIRITDTTAQQYGYTAGLLMDKYGSAVKPRTLPTLAACVLRACVTDGRNYGPVMTETYFVSPDMDDYDDILILNITLDPDDFTGGNGIYAVVSDDIFAERERCDGFMEIFEEDGSTAARQYVQLAMNGNGSLAFKQKSMRVYVREADTVSNGGTLAYDLFDGAAVDADGNVIDQYKSFLLRNSGNDASCAHFRDALMQELSKDLNACIQAYRPSLLFINGEFWGLYNLRERYDENYFAAHFGILPENLTILESISPLLTGSWNTRYELNTGEAGDEQDFYDLVDYVAEHDMKVEEAFAYVESRMDLDNFMDFFIASCYLANTDWPGNNIKVWRNKSPNDPSGLDTRWRWVLSDMDFGIGHSTETSTQMFTHALTEDTVCGKLMKRLLANTAYRLKFADRAADICNTVYDPDITLAMLDTYRERIEPYIEMNFLRWRGDGGSMDNWYAHIDRIRYFLENRTPNFIHNMEDKLNVVLDTVTTEAEHASVSVNAYTAEDGSLALYFRDSTPVTVNVQPDDGYRVVGMNVKVGPRESFVEGDTYTFEVYAKTTISVVTERE
ncbi:MAG: CotH kinase family protein [Eubacteriales bacterium]